MSKTILKKNEDAFILVMGCRSLNSGLTFSPRADVDTKEGIDPGQWYKGIFSYKYFRSLDIDYRAIRDDTAILLRPTREEYRIIQ
jgi:hypothetical protein